MVGFLDEGLLVLPSRIFHTNLTVSVVGFLDEGLLEKAMVALLGRNFVSVVGFLDEGLLDNGCSLRLTFIEFQWLDF
ncbi:TPA: hypothetical protein I8Z56_001515 [Legionella pneumophila]|nr:hypothetical protein [Legionella pneumophila]